MTDDAEATLFQAIRAITPRNFGDDSLAGQHERAVLLTAIETYNGNLAVRLAGVSEALTHAEQQLAVYDKLIPDVARWQLMQAKAAVCNLIMVVPGIDEKLALVVLSEDNWKHDDDGEKLLEALKRVRELEAKT